jgi:hypothetical protein
VELHHVDGLGHRLLTDQLKWVDPQSAPHILEASPELFPPPRGVTRPQVRTSFGVSRKPKGSKERLRHVDLVTCGNVQIEHLILRPVPPPGGALRLHAIPDHDPRQLCRHRRSPPGRPGPHRRGPRGDRWVTTSNHCDRRGGDIWPTKASRREHPPGASARLSGRRSRFRPRNPRRVRADRSTEEPRRIPWAGWCLDRIGRSACRGGETYTLPLGARREWHPGRRDPLTWLADVLLSQQFATATRWLTERLAPEESQPNGDHRP